MSPFSCRCLASLQKPSGTSTCDTMSGTINELSECIARQSKAYILKMYTCEFPGQRSTVPDTCHDCHLKQLLPNNRDIKQASSHWANRGVEARQLACIRDAPKIWGSGVKLAE